MSAEARGALQCATSSASQSAPARHASPAASTSAEPELCTLSAPLAAGAVSCLVAAFERDPVLSPAYLLRGGP